MLCLLAAAAVWLPTTRPNIVVILSDDHARQAVSCYGSKLIQTPAIDSIAAQGVRFDRFMTTNPICGPSRATLLTGKYSHINGFRDNNSTFDGAQETFPKMLQAAGYETAVVGKWHLTSNPTGFDYWEVLPGQGVYYNPDFLTPNGKVTEHGYVTSIITQKALGWLSNHGSKPFYLQIGHKAPHRSWAPDLSKLNLFANTAFPEPATLRTSYDGLTSAAKTVRMRIDTNMRLNEDLWVDNMPPRLDADQSAAWTAAMTDQDLAYHRKLEESDDLLGTNYQRYLANYLRCVSSVDDGVGEVLAYLKERKLLDNTVVIYLSDQGFFLGENAWYDKRWFYEPSAGTPLIVRPAGGLKKPRSNADVVCNADLAPTILELAGLKPTPSMQGRSVAGCLGSKVQSLPPIPAYGHFYESDDGDHKAPKYVAVATDRHKLIFYYDLKEWELFDLSRDPNETKSLWQTIEPKTRHEMVRKLLSRMRTLMEEPWLIEFVEAQGGEASQ